MATEFVIEMLNEDDTYVIEMGDVTLVPEIPFPGSTNLPPGTQNATLAELDRIKAQKSDTATLEEFDALKEQFTDTRSRVDDFDARAEAIETNQQAIQRDLEGVISTLAGIDVAGISSYVLNANNELVFILSDATSLNLGYFPADKGYRGNTTSAPTVAGAVGDFFRNTNAATKIDIWRCTIAGGAGVAAWTPIGAPDLAGVSFDIDANRAYRHRAEKAMTLAAPGYGGTTSGVTFVWEYSASGAGTSWTAASFPLTMAAGRILRCTVTGLPANAWAVASLERTA